MKKKLFVLGMCIALVCSVTACKKEDKKEDTTSESASQGSALAEGVNEKDKVVDGENKMVELSDYKELQVYSSQIEITDTSLESSISSILANYPVKEGTVSATDVVNINYVGKIDGKEFEGGSANGQTLDIANNTYIKGFASGLVGKKIGDTVDLNLRFPDDYWNEDYRGKDVVFTVTLNSKNPELTDEFVKKNLSKEYESSNVAEFKKYVKEQMILNQKYSLIWSDYVESCQVEISQEKVDELVKSGVAYYENYVSSNTGSDLKTYLESQSSSYEEFEQSLVEEAKASLKEQIVAEAIAEKENIAVSDEEYQKEVEYYMNNYDYKTVEDFEKDYKKEEVMQNILYYNVVEWVCNQVKVTEGEPPTESSSGQENTEKETGTDE